MCDTSVAVGTSTADGSVIFAKNSDRPANECQPLRYYPAATFSAGASVRCTHRAIPQARETLAVVGSQPWWMWGFEMGVNERGVAIGNEAVYGRDGYAEDGLLGMDLLRLGLERGRSADEALHVMVDLLEEFGQGGSADVSTPRSYHNSYIIADGAEAWVFETAGRYWAAEKVKGRRAISNCYTIGTEWDEASKDLVDHAVAQGWWDRRRDFNFALAYGDQTRDFSSGQCRYARATTVLGGAPKLTVPDLMRVLRDHAGVRSGAAGEEISTPICMHETPPNLGATAASLVVHLRSNVAKPLSTLAWHSFGSPCLSAFHPIYVGPTTPLAQLGIGDGRYDSASPWWRNERIQRRADRFPALKTLVQSTWNDAEAQAFAAIDEIESRFAAEPDVDVNAILQACCDRLSRDQLDQLRLLDEATERDCADPVRANPADAQHWSQLNDPVGLALAARA